MIALRDTRAKLGSDARATTTTRPPINVQRGRTPAARRRPAAGAGAAGMASAGAETEGDANPGRRPTPSLMDGVRRRAVHADREPGRAGRRTGSGPRTWSR